MKTLEVTLKSQSETRWSAKKKAIHSLNNQITNVCNVLQEISNDSLLNAETRSGAREILIQVDFEFLCWLDLWNMILTLIDRENRSLQSKNMTIDIASKKIAGLIASIENLRDRGIHNSMKKAEIISKDLDIEASFPIKRKGKAKRMFDDETREESSHIPPEINCNIVFDSIITQLHWRFETMAEISSDFEFLNGNSLASMSVEDLKKCGDKLCQKYVRDLNANKFLSEIESFKFQASVLTPDLKKRKSIENLAIYAHLFFD